MTDALEPDHSPECCGRWRTRNGCGSSTVCAGPRNVSELAALLGVEIVNVSHHLGVLRHAHVVLDEKQGRFVVYRLHPDVFHPTTGGPKAEHLDLGCCRLEIPRVRKRDESS